MSDENTGSIKRAIARNIVASENEQDYYLAFLGKDKLKSFADFYEKNRVELEDIIHIALRNFLKGQNRDSATYNAAQEMAEAVMSFFAGSYNATQIDKSQDENNLTSKKSEL